MREIKFRAWDGKKMRPVDQITMAEKSWNCENGYGVSIPYMPHVELMQYTGLKDEGGKEIYEGDIVYQHSTSTTGKVVFERGKFVIKWQPTAGYVMFDSNIDDAIYEILGNIHEHPELLK